MNEKIDEIKEEVNDLSDEDLSELYSYVESLIQARETDKELEQSSF